MSRASCSDTPGATLSLGRSASSLILLKYFCCGRRPHAKARQRNRVRGLMTLGAAGSDARAREERADRYFEEIIEIAKDSSGDYTEDRNGERVVDHENMQRSRLRVDALKSSARSGCPVAALGWPRVS